MAITIVPTDLLPGEPNPNIPQPGFTFDENGVIVGVPTNNPSAPVFYENVNQPFNTDPVTNTAPFDSQNPFGFTDAPITDTFEPTATNKPVIVSPDTEAMIQKGKYHERGFYGDQAITNDFAGFNNAIGIASSLLGTALSISAINATTQSIPRDKNNYYYLYDNEKALLRRKAAEFAAIGVVPYDALEEFLYILVTVRTADDLKYIAAVTNIVSLYNASLVREPLLILNLPMLYKIGYLANAVACVNKKYTVTFTPNKAYDSSLNNYSSLMEAARTGQTFAQFPAVNQSKSLLTDIISQFTGITAITNLFSSFNGLPHLAMLPSVISQLTNLNNNLTSTIDLAKRVNIKGLSNNIPQMMSLRSETRNINDYATKLAGITSIVSDDPRRVDIRKKMDKIKLMSANAAILASTLSTALGNIAGPGAGVGGDAGEIDKYEGGYAFSGILTEETIGQRIPPSILYKNPMLQSPSYMGKAFFGETPGVQAAIDQKFSKLIGAYPKPQNGAGNFAFGMQNFGSLSGSIPLSSMSNLIVTGSIDEPEDVTLLDIVEEITDNLCNILGVAATVNFEPRRSDNALPFMVGMAAAVLEETSSPYSIDMFAESWQLASGVGNHLQNSDPEMLIACREVL
jgi:hypothetical protein